MKINYESYLKTYTRDRIHTFLQMEDIKSYNDLIVIFQKDGSHLLFSLGAPLFTPNPRIQNQLNVGQIVLFASKKPCSSTIGLF